MVSRISNSFYRNLSSTIKEAFNSYIGKMPRIISVKIFDQNGHCEKGDGIRSIEDIMHEHVLDASCVLKKGNIIAVPTDTIYGVTGLAQNTEALKKIYDIKCRQLSKPIAICVADIDDVYKWGKVSVCRNLLEDLLPGPVTLVFERTKLLNCELNVGTNLVGIRIPNNHFIRNLARKCDEPLALTSANISSTMSTLAIEEFTELWPRLDLICDGGQLGDTIESRQGSTVVDLSQGSSYKIIRDGSALSATVNVLKNKYGLNDIS